MRVLLLHNPTAGSGGADRRELLSLLRRHGYRPSYQSTKQTGWKRALRVPYGLVVVAGGDGTVAKVLRRLGADAPPVAILPSGSANNIALSLGIDGDHEAWVRQWPRAAQHAFRRARVRVDGRERMFVEAVGLGVFPAVIGAPDADSANGEAKVAHGTGALLAQLREARVRTWRIELDGETREVEAIMLEVLNVPLIGPRLNLAPTLAAGSGRLEVVVVPATRREELLELLQQDPARRPAAGFSIARVERLSLLVDRSPLHVDDKLWPKRIGRRTRIDIAVDATPIRLLHAGPRDA